MIITVSKSLAIPGVLARLSRGPAPIQGSRILHGTGHMAFRDRWRPFVLRRAMNVSFFRKNRGAGVINDSYCYCMISIMTIVTMFNITSSTAQGGGGSFKDRTL